MADLLALKGLMHGWNYGTKIRMPHALVMTFLFKPDLSLHNKFRQIMKLSFLHARNLSAFVLLYKLCLSAGTSAYKVIGVPVTAANGRPAAQWHALAAGAIGGWVIWGNYNTVNFQIVLYLLSRVVVALVRLLAKKGVLPFRNFSFKPTYPWLASATWAVVMWLFEFHSDTLHGSLVASMKYLYHDSNSWASPRDFAPSAPALAMAAAILFDFRHRLSDLLDFSKKL